jgi:hypothetical protein
MTEEQFSVRLIVCTIAVGIATQLGVVVLDQVAAEQCRQHRWPAHLNDTHRDWCISNGYNI